MRSGFLGRGMGPNALGGGAAAVDWWLANGTIALANVLEYVENPAARQLYAGAAATGAWSVSFRTNLIDVLAGSASNYAFDAQTGRVLFGLANSGGNNGVFIAAWNSNGTFANGDHSYMFVSDGSAIQCYRDSSAVGAAIATANNIGGAVRWRSRYADSGGWSDWPVAIRAGHVANVALDATQRAALHAAMMALA